MRIISVAFDTDDLLRAESFYSSVLGLPTTREEGVLSILAGSSQLTLHEAPTGPGKQHLTFTIPRLMFDSAKEWIAGRVPLLRDADGRDEFDTAPHWNAHSLYFADPDGNILEFIIRRDISDDRTGPFRAEHVQCISEVGIAVRDVPGVAARAESVLGIGAYGSGAPTFRPVGNVEGLLILVSPGRHWFPTATPSGARRLIVNIDSRATGALEPGPGITIHSNAAHR
ncbi:VOC family protein [Arthrobacter bambusae]|uniref:VOC family protein n=1 Tax=Arthrobacter bambusae TaxID=1338426 RepID=UPI002781DCE3|nr:VOC family protein [Arthrobacter bambusae]MDQ0213095.1 catechol 2,3-dioxygenase-like lactoylglutathione lyase family enzyme [Arthrobacter bambusae]MDQ0237455.1 catechol 2,3-dioxygenase-like lactoylglutathione lyase family enzyme [Arthrobacter bambusae]